MNVVLLHVLTMAPVSTSSTTSHATVHQALPDIHVMLTSTTVTLTLVKRMPHVSMVSIIAPVVVLWNFMVTTARKCELLVILTPVKTKGIVLLLGTRITVPASQDLRVKTAQSTLMTAEMTRVFQMLHVLMVLITSHASALQGTMENSVTWKLESAIQTLVRTMEHVLT